MLPEHVPTLIDMLAVRARISGDQTAFTFNGQTVSFAELWQALNRFAAFLLKRGISPGERVLIALPNSPEFFPAFYGIQRAGGIAVPVFPGSGAERIFSMAGLCGAQFIVLPSTLPARALDRFRQLAKGRRLSLVTVQESLSFSPAAYYPSIKPTDIAFLQYTSGSTGDPKGVILTHQALLTNMRQMIAGMQITPGEIFVSWLPVYHDMGLILKTMVPFYLAAQVHLLPTDLRDVRPWLEAIHTRRATFTAAPDFAYRLCLRHAEPGAYDLSCLRVALNAAEPVRASTVRSFHRFFGLQDVMVAGYGLAEATVGVSMGAPGKPVRVDAHGRVSAGRPFPGVDLCILPGSQSLPPGKIGEIAIRGPANTLGYFNNQAATSRLYWQDGYLRSGDLGYLDEDGCLYIAGRLKNIIKRSGETLSPQEIEELVDALPAVRFSAAVGLDRGGPEGEQVYVFAEIREADSLPEGELHMLAIQMVANFHARMGFRPARVYLLKPRTIPLTHNGKIQHLRLREMYLDGSLRGQGAILYPAY